MKKETPLKRIVAIVSIIMFTVAGTKTMNAQTLTKYDDVGAYSEGLAIVRVGDYRNAKYGFIDKSSNEIVPPIYQGVEKFSDGMAIIKQDYKYGFVDNSGNVIVPPFYDTARSFNNGMARVMKNGKYGYINKSGIVKVEIKYYQGENFSEGLAAVANENYKYGFVGKSGEVIIPFKYDSVDRTFTNGSIKVQRNGEWFKINKKGVRID